jgi:hypothetical protein
VKEIHLASSRAAIPEPAFSSKIKDSFAYRLKEGFRVKVMRIARLTNFVTGNLWGGLFVCRVLNAAQTKIKMIFVLILLKVRTRASLWATS